MQLLIAALCALAAGCLVLWLRREALLRVRTNTRDALAGGAATGAMVEAAVAALIVVHLFGYSMTGWAVLITLGIVGNAAPLLFGRFR